MRRSRSGEGEKLICAVPEPSGAVEDEDGAETELEFESLFKNSDDHKAEDTHCSGIAASSCKPWRLGFRSGGLIVLVLLALCGALLIEPLSGSSGKILPANELPGDDGTFNRDGELVQEIWTDPMRHPHPGTNMVFFGPLRFKSGPVFATAFQPIVDVGIVHHMVVYKSKQVFGAEAQPRYRHFGDIFRDQDPVTLVLFAWARTGQPEALKFEVVEGAGFWLGPGTDAEEIYLNVHFEVPEEAIQDRKEIKAGLRIFSFSKTPQQVERWRHCYDSSEDCSEEQGVAVHVLNQWHFTLPPQRMDIDVTYSCKLSRDIILYAYRNHGHSAGRMWITELFRDGVSVRTLVNRSVQDPQIFYKFTEQESSFSRMMFSTFIAITIPLGGRK